MVGWSLNRLRIAVLLVARTRLVSQHMHMKYEGAERLYYSTFQTMRIIVQQEGVRGLYKGLTASFLGLSHVAVQFPLYEALKEAMAEPPEPEPDADSDAARYSGLGNSWIAKSAAKAATAELES